MSPPPKPPSRERLLHLVEAMAGRPVPMLVDLVADRFVTGTPKRISREAPVMILEYQGEHITPGGGANAVANVAALGGRPLPLGIVGEDASGRDLLAALAERGVDLSGIRTRAGYRTPTKVRILAGARHAIKQQVVRYDVEDRLELAAADRAAFVEQLAAWRGLWGGEAAPVAILSDYGYGTVPPAMVPVLRQALGGAARLLCDSRYRLGEMTGCDGATPNEEEAEALFGGPLEDEVRPAGAGGGGDGGGDGTPGTGAGSGHRLASTGEALRRRLATRFLLITRGSRGMSLFTPSAAAHLPVHGTDQVADVTGAGDTVIGTFALALAAGATPLEAATLADYAGGVVVMKMGTATVSPEELVRAVESDPVPLAEMRIEAAMEPPAGAVEPPAGAEPNPETARDARTDARTDAGTDDRTRDQEVAWESS